MMPQIGFSEMLLMGILALVVLGPKDLPLMMRKFGRMTGKLRAMAWEFQQSFDELGRQAELEELKKEVQALKKNTGIDEIKSDIEKVESDVAKDMGAAEAEMRAAKAAKSSSGSEPSDTDKSKDAPSTEDKVG